MPSGTLLITGSAVALHCCKAHAKSNTKIWNSTTCKIVTPKNFILKVCTRDYVAMQILVSIGTVEASPQLGEILPPCPFLTVLYCPVRTFFSILRPGRTAGFMAQTTCFRARMVLLGVRAMGKICPQNSPKMGVNRQFPAKTAKYIKIAISPKL